MGFAAVKVSKLDLYLYGEHKQYNETTSIQIQTKYPHWFFNYWLGHTVKNLPVGLRNKYSEVSWREIIGTRDKMIHHYFGIDLEMVWKIIKEDLPILKKQIEKILKKEN